MEICYNVHMNKTEITEASNAEMVTISRAEYDAYAAAKLQSNRSSPTPRPLKSDTLSAGPTVGVVSVETGLFVGLHAA